MLQELVKKCFQCDFWPHLKRFELFKNQRYHFHPPAKLPKQRMLVEINNPQVHEGEIKFCLCPVVVSIVSVNRCLLRRDLLCHIKTKMFHKSRRKI